MSFENYKDSQNDVITTIAPTLSTFLNELRKEMPNCGVVYDPSLSYETAIAKHRADNNFDEDSDTQLPLFAFRRTVLTEIEDATAFKRLSQLKIRGDITEDGTIIYAGAAGQFQIEYIYFAKDMEQAERFEVSHIAKRGITGIRTLDVYLGESLGNTTYIFEHEQLSDLTDNQEGNSHKALGGVVTVRGLYLLFETKNQVIKETVAKINNFINGEEYGSLLGETSSNTDT
jgi:methionine synthase II (cobalamin-independent)